MYKLFLLVKGTNNVQLTVVDFASKSLAEKAREDAVKVINSESNVKVRAWLSQSK